MNRLKLLRRKANLTLRDLEKYVGIRNATLSAIENGKQPFREIHVMKLTSFFDVTSDYLLGYVNTGIGIYFENSEDDEDHVMISASELEKLNEKYEVKETLLTHDSSLLEINTGTYEKRLYTGKYSIFRSVDIPKEQAGISVSIKGEILKELDRLDQHDLNKVLKFIKEYIR